MATTKTLREIRGEGVCPDCGRRAVSLHLYPPDSTGGIASCAVFTCGYVERFSMPSEAETDPVEAPTEQALRCRVGAGAAAV